MKLDISRQDFVEDRLLAARGSREVLLVLVNDERPGSLRVEPHDYGWKGGPPMPARFQPWLAGSPYARCAAD